MKKSIIAVAALLIGSTAYAQEKVYLPEEGDWAIGVDATPFLNYFGNFIGGDGLNAAPTWNFQTINQTITGKYFVSSEMAYRGSLRLGFGFDDATRSVVDRSSTVTPEFPSTMVPMVDNKQRTSFTNIGLSGGLEFRKGKGRLQGFYGGELGIAFASQSETYTYGNELTLSTANNPVFVAADDDFGSNLITDAFGNPARITAERSGTTLGVGARGFIGAEYFILPKLSLGAEFGWGLMFVSNGAGSITSEALGVDNNGAELLGEVKIEGNRSSGFGIDTDNMNTVFGPAGSIRIVFHF
ncbi:MAG: hypothetical protein JJT77_07430 [Crocinitomicaceae bacterium]|nr:hypothetical protein [Crocinitomicaceae bacterium]